MQGLSVKVNPAILNWALKKAQLSAVVNTAVIEELSRWISGEKTPTFSQIEQVSKKIRVPFGYFFLQDPPEEVFTLVDFRTVDSIHINNPSRDLLDTVDLMSSVQDWMADYVKESGADINAVVGTVRITDDVKHTATTIRKELGLAIDWYKNHKQATEAFKHLRDSIMELGVLIMMNGVVGNNNHRVLDVEEFRAFTLINPYAPLIFINSRDAENGKLFSLLHEYVHVLIGKDSFYNDVYGTAARVSKEEQFCNAVAAEILVPENDFIVEWKKRRGKTEEIIDVLAKSFICSRFVLLRKALTLRMIGQAEYDRVNSLLQMNLEKQKKSSGGDFYRNLNVKWDRRVIQALYVSAQSGRTQYRDIYRLTNTNGKTFHAFIERLGGI